MPQPYILFLASVDWSAYYGEYAKGRKVDFVDIGCGYGGLLVKLSELYPESLMLGLEIRVKVTAFIFLLIAFNFVTSLDIVD